MSSPQEAYSRCHKGLTQFSDEPHPRVWFTFHYRNPLMWNPEPLQRSLGHTPTTQSGASKSPQHRLGSKDQSNKLTNFHFHESSWREQTDATNAKGKNTLSSQILHSKIQPKQLMLWRDLRGRTRGETHRTPKARSTRFPSLRGGMDWWNGRSRSPLFNP